MTTLNDQLKRVRYDNARKILQTRCNGVIQTFANKIDRSHSQIRAFLSDNPRSGIGATIASKIEQAFDLPDGWMDEPHDATLLHHDTQIDQYIDKLKATMLRKPGLMLGQYSLVKMYAESLAAIERNMEQTLRSHITKLISCQYSDIEYDLNLVLFGDTSVYQKEKSVTVADSINAALDAMLESRSTDFDLWVAQKNVREEFYLVKLPEQFLAKYKDYSETDVRGDQAVKISSYVGRFTVSLGLDEFDVEKAIHV